MESDHSGSVESLANGPDPESPLAGEVLDRSIMKLVAEWQQEGKGVVFFGDTTQILAVAALKDPVKETTFTALNNSAK